MTVREMIHRREREMLAPWATRSEESRGRVTPEEPCPIRTDFQRDRDRIVHCRAFRRLAHKTQVFILSGHDHIRTRLTHTLEVAQIAKTLARALCLNEDLVEAIALAHDLGHTPFGHTGEASLNEAVQQQSPSLRFEHWEQSLRVVDVLERGGQGLNLTWEVRQGILGHTKGRKDLAAASGGGEDDGPTLESLAVKISDRVAYVNHDLEDAIRARVLPSEDVPRHLLEILGHTHSDRIGTVVANIIAESEGKPELRISQPIVGAMNELKEFLFERVYYPNSADEDQRVRTVVTGLFNYYCDQELQREQSDSPDASGGAASPAESGGFAPESAGPWRKASTDAPAAEEESGGCETDGHSSCRKACDYVAGMTDRFAVQRYMDLFVPHSARYDEA